MKKWMIGIIISLVVIVIGSFISYQYVIAQIHGKPSPESFDMTIEEGASLKSVLYTLQKHGLMNNAQYRYVYMRLTQPDYTFQAGTYHIEQGITVDDALAKFQRGDVVMAEVVRITIPEGWNIRQITERLSKEEFIDENKFMALLSDENFYNLKRKKYTFLPEIHKDVKYPFEGYLFPETYEFPKDITEEEIIDRLLDETEKIVSELAIDYPELRQNTSDVFTLASIVEEETAVLEERPRVAGVFFNRLEKGMKLQSDATVQYVLGKQHERVLYEHLEQDDPYNTYRYEGLPPGPIASPGRVSLEAILNPEDHDYLYFVTKKDGSREHYFSKTFEEHKKFNELSRQEKPQKTAGR